MRALVSVRTAFKSTVETTRRLSRSFAARSSSVSPGTAAVGLAFPLLLVVVALLPPLLIPMIVESAAGTPAPSRGSNKFESAFVNKAPASTVIAAAVGSSWTPSIILPTKDAAVWRILVVTDSGTAVRRCVTPAPISSARSDTGRKEVAWIDWSSKASRASNIALADARAAATFALRSSPFGPAASVPSIVIAESGISGKPLSAEIKAAARLRAGPPLPSSKACCTFACCSSSWTRNALLAATTAAALADSFTIDNLTFSSAFETAAFVDATLSFAAATFSFAVIAVAAAASALANATSTAALATTPAAAAASAATSEALDLSAAASKLAFFVAALSARALFPGSASAAVAAL